MRTLTALLAAALMTLVLAVPAAAVKPYTWYDEDFDDFYPAVGDCGDFVVDERSVGHHSEVLYFGDKDYTVTVRTLYKARGTDYLINHDTLQQIAADFSLQCHVDIVTEDPLVYVRKCTGRFWNLSLPGEGLIAHRAGQSVEYVEGEPGASGDLLKETGAFWFDEDAVCAALR